MPKPPRIPEQPPLWGEEPPAPEDADTSVDVSGVDSLTLEGLEGALEARTMQAAVRLLEDRDNDGVHEDLGRGNPEQRRLHGLKQDIVRAFYAIGHKYRPQEKGDKNAYKLEQALMAVFKVSETKGWNIEAFVSETLDSNFDMGDITKADKRHATARLYSSLGLLKLGFKQARPEAHPDPDGDGKALLEQWQEGPAASDLWQDEELTTAVLRGVEGAYRLVGMMSSTEGRSVEAFITKIQLELVRKGLDQQTPSRSNRRAWAAHKRALTGAVSAGWQDFEHKVLTSM